MPGPRRESSSETAAKFLALRHERQQRTKSKRRWFEHQLDLPLQEGRYDRE